MPVSTSDYEKAASEAMGVPVKIGSAGMSVLAGVEMKFNNVAIGDRAKIRLVRGSPELGSLFGGRKSFNRIELEGVSASQSQIADTDMSLEMVNFTKNQILMQAGTAMLAQANAVPQTILKLLQ